MSCGICGGGTREVLRKEANVSCSDYFTGRRLYPEDLGALALTECIDCGFAEFQAFRAWREEDFRERIYNDAYHLCDTPFKEERPQRLSAWLGPLVGADRLLDFGGGEGALAAKLRAWGVNAESFDPYYGDFRRPTGLFAIVTAFEVVEHVCDQRALFAALRTLTAEDGVLVFSTLLKPERMTGDWWYLSPRNGHVCAHTGKSLGLIAAQSGLALQSLSNEMHVASRTAQALLRFTEWPAPAVNETPAFFFTEHWSRLADASGQ